ncbi:MAG: response regulator [Pedobacter sp.]|nr:MAG: response regulator [Pedobacter sp.]
MSNPLKKKRMQKHIMVIEDNHAILDVITLILQSEAYKVEGRQNSVDLLEEINKFKPDLIIMDIMLPDADGRELLAKIRMEESTKDIPVLMISARYTADNLRSEAHTPNGFLSKPFDIDALLDHIEGLIAGKNLF